MPLKKIEIESRSEKFCVSEDKWYRVRALRNVIVLNDYDVIRSAVPYASYFESFNECSGYFLPGRRRCQGMISRIEPKYVVICQKSSV